MVSGALAKLTTLRPVNRRPRHHRIRRPDAHAGLTLVELMVTLVVLAVLTTLAVPSFSGIIKSTRISSAVNVFMADLRYTRSEAVKRGVNVVMCRSDSPEAAAPTCGSTVGGPDGSGLATGWIVFVDLNDDGIFNSSDTLLRVRPRFENLSSIYANGLTVAAVRYRFNAQGRLRSLGTGAGAVQFGDTPQITREQQRVVCIDLAGRARIAGDGFAGCT